MKLMRISMTVEKATVDALDEYLKQFKNISRSFAINMAMDFVIKNPKYTQILRQFDEE